MRIESVEIKNIFGTEQVRFEPKSVTLIRGGNGVGKSSVLRAISIVFAGGSDPSWLRKGTDSGYIKLEVSGWSQRGNVSITKKIARSKRSGEIRTELEILDPDGNVVPAPQTFIGKLADSRSVDPGQLLAIDASTAEGRREITKRLLAVMPISFSPEEIADSFSENGEVPGQMLDLLPGETLTFDGLKKFSEGIIETRRRIGAQVKQTADGSDALRRSLPTQPPEDCRAEVERLQVDLEAGKAEFERAQTAVRQNADERRRRLRDEIQSKIDALIAERDIKDQQIGLECANTLQANENIARPVLDKMGTDLAAARERLREHDRAEGIRASIVQFEAEHKVARARYEQLSRALERLEALRKRKLENLPITGLSFNGQDFLVDGVEWQNVNRARLRRVAVEFGAQLAGDLAFMILDDSEHDDSENAAALQQDFLDAGYQVVIARVNTPEEMAREGPGLKIVSMESAGVQA